MKKRHFRTGNSISTLTIFLFWVFFCCNSALSLAQPDIQFDHVSIEQDLSSNVISCIFQDRNGFMWIGTEDGLNRFDGYETIIFRNNPEDTSSISSNWVFCMLQDQQGAIWIGTKTGLNRLDPETGRIQRFLDYRHGEETIRLNDLYVIYEDRKGNLWLGSDQFHRLDPVTGKFSLLPLPDHASSEILNIFYMQEDNQGRLLVGSNLGLFLIDVETEELQQLDLPGLTGQPKLEKGIRGFWQNTPDGLWIAGQSDLFQINLTNYRLDNLASGVFTNLDFWAARTITGDRAGHIWLGSTTGLNRVNPATGQMEVFLPQPQNPSSITAGIGEQLFFDRQGSLWIGGGKGLDRLPSKYLDQFIYPEKSAYFSHFQIASEGTLSDKRKMIRCFLKDRNGNFWIGTYDGLFRFPAQKQESSLIRHFSAEAATPYSLSGNGIRALLEDRRGDIWVATTKGLNWIDARSGQIEQITFNQIAPNGLTDAVFWSLLEDDQGNIWIGTMASGVLCLDPVSRQARHFMQDPEKRTTLSANEILKILK